MLWKAFGIKTRILEGGKDGRPGNVRWMDHVVDGTISAWRGEVHELDDGLGGAVKGEPRDLFVELGEDPGRVCTLHVQIL